MQCNFSEPGGNWLHEENSTDELQSIGWRIHNYLYPALLAVCVMGNGATLVTLLSEPKLTTSGNFLTSMALADLFYVCVH